MNKKSMSLIGWIVVVVFIIIIIYYFSPESGIKVTRSIGEGLNTVGQKGSETIGNYLANGS